MHGNLGAHANRAKLSCSLAIESQSIGEQARVNQTAH